MGMRSIEARKATWRDFYVDEGRRKFICRIFPKEGPVPPRPMPYSELKAERIEWAWGDYERARRRAAWLPDDVVPYVRPFTGTEIFAAAFGCRVARPEGDMPFAEPMVHTSAEAAKLTVPDLDAPPLRILFEMADELRRRGGPEVLMSLPDIQSPMDIAALIWDKTDLFCAMVTEPEAVKEVAGKAMELLTAFLDEWFSRYGRELISHYPAYYLPWGVTLSEDEIGSVNPEMFEEFFLPTLCALSERYDGIGIHCCAASKHQWPGFRKVSRLRLLNLGGPSLSAEDMHEAYRFFSPEVAHWHGGWQPEGPLWEALEAYPPGTRAVLSFFGVERAEALDIAAKMTAARERLAKSATA